MLCKLLPHKWSGCICLRCQATRHDWDNCHCRKCGTINHEWDGCVCRKCGDKRDQGHNWKGCRCRICKEVRDEGHDWYGCQCNRCGAVRDQDHKWEGCRCIRCGKTKEHEWDGCICRICGVDRHEWDGCICKKCSITRNEHHTFIGCKCTRCGMASKNIATHKWQAGECTTCGAKSTELFCNHIWENDACSLCGLTQDLALIEFCIPSKVEPLMGIGRHMRGLGENLSEVERVGDCYYLHIKVSGITRKGGGPAITGGQILSAHVKAASIASQILRKEQNQTKLSDPLIEKHINQQNKLCTCGKLGFRDFAYGSIGNSGLATIEYKCICCGKSETFTIDHAR